MIGKIAVGGVEEGGCLFGGWWVLKEKERKDPQKKSPMQACSID
jgi:hypothetical protein